MTTEPTLLDLVRQYGSQRDAVAAARADGLGDRIREHGAEAEALFARIAELAPQQPVQARDEDGNGWWIHDCGEVGEFTSAPSDEGCDRCSLEGPWRPLLVGGDLAAERIESPEESAAIVDMNLRAMGADGLALERPGLIAQVAEDYRQQRDDARAEVERLKAANELLDAQRLDAWAHVHALDAAQPDPLVLSLPTIPEGAVALVGASSGATYPPGVTGWHSDQHGDLDLGALLDHEGSVRVEMAPPREPRTWPKITAVPWELSKVEVEGHGTWFRYQHRETDFWHQGNDSAQLPFTGLLTLGAVTEVFDA